MYIDGCWILKRNGDPLLSIKTGHEIPKVLPPPTILVDLAWSHNNHKNPNLASSRVNWSRAHHMADATHPAIVVSREGTNHAHWFILLPNSFTHNFDPTASTNATQHQIPFVATLPQHIRRQIHIVSKSASTLEWTVGNPPLLMKCNCTYNCNHTLFFSNEM